MSKTLDRTEMAYWFLSGFGLRNFFVIGSFVIHQYRREYLDAPYKTLALIDS